MLERRNALEAVEIARRSRRVQELLLTSKEFQSAKIVGVYYAFGSEVKTDLIIEQARSLGKKVALPSVEGDSLTFYELSSGRYLVKGRFGIMEPLPYGQVDDKIDLLVVPGIAFDKKGYRLGYGKGYYDKYLAKKRIVSIGLAYSFQLLEDLPRDKHDERLDAIATEDGIYYV
jgi:5-formyltetrahydrofolate cyclo-ligase